MRASRKLHNDERLLSRWAGTMLRKAMDAVPLWRGDHVAVKQLVEDFARYPYLQRLAVDPAWQSRGIGRSLVRTAAAWAQGQGASALLLNTPDGNQSATSLYATEGFDTVTRDLAVLSRTA